MPPSKLRNTETMLSVRRLTAVLVVLILLFCKLKQHLILFRKMAEMFAQMSQVSSRGHLICPTEKMMQLMDDQNVKG